MNSSFFKKTVVLIGFVAGVNSPLAFSETVEARGKLASIDYGTRKLQLQRHEGTSAFRILFDATIKLANGEYGSIGNVRKNATVAIVYDDANNAISHIEIIDRSR